MDWVDKRLWFLYSRFKAEGILGDDVKNLESFRAAFRDMPIEGRWYLLRRDESLPLSVENGYWSPTSHNATARANQLVALALHYGIADGRFYTLPELSAAFGVSYQGIQQQVKAALRRLEKVKQS